VDGLTACDIAASSGYIENLMKLCSWATEVKSFIEDNTTSLGHNSRESNPGFFETPHDVVENCR
jgi:hypothetical protein